MSWLLLDVGNSTLKWTLVPPDAAPCSSSAKGSGAGPPLQGQLPGMLAIDAPALQATLAAELSRAVGGGAPQAARWAPTASWGCAVAAPEKIAAIDAAVLAAGSPAVQWLSATARFDHNGIHLRNGYREPAQLGADRWHALIGARARLARGPLVVINAGTATTIDAIDESGQFVGGVIAPGVELMRASLAHGTARLPLAEGDYVAHPDNTNDAIRTGILDAQIGLIAQRLQRVRELAGSGVQVIVSGGNGALLLALLRAQGGLGTMMLEPDLVVLGLWHRAHALTAEALANRTS